MHNLAISAIFFATAFGNVALAVEETLQNDGFTSGAAVSFQAGFVAGEVAAARFVPQIACPCVVESVTLLFGGLPTTRDMGVNIWEDATGADTPGALLFTGSVSLTGSNVNLQLIDLSLTPVIVNGPFRVGLEFGHDGAPTVATDEDGSIDVAANFILADIGGFLFWFRSATLAVSGDFVIRATIDNFVVTDTDADGVADDTDNCTDDANPNQTDGDGDGIGNLCDADLNNDCMIDFLDLGAMKAVFFSADPVADLNADGFVDFLDLGIIKSDFFGTPGPAAPPNVCTP